MNSTEKQPDISGEFSSESKSVDPGRELTIKTKHISIMIHEYPWALLYEKI